MITTFFQLILVLTSMQVSELAEISNPVRIVFFSSKHVLYLHIESAENNREINL